MEDRIVELAGAGVPNNIIASTVGCDPSYVTQVLGKEENASRVMEMRGAKAAKMLARDAKIEQIEDAALDRAMNLVNMQTDLMKVTRVFQVFNAAKKSSDHGINPAANGAGVTVTLELPQAAEMHFRLTSDRQVIEIEGRSMVPMPSQQVAKQLRELQANRLLEQTQTRMLSDKTRSIVDQL
jgi:hypothetical protein